MKEVSGPVIGIALILSSVFLPVAFMGGIQGRLNNQFARDDRDLGADLGLQRVDAFAGAFRAAAAGRGRNREACSAASSAASTGGSTRRRTGMSTGATR